MIKETPPGLNLVHLDKATVTHAKLMLANSDPDHAEALAEALHDVIATVSEAQGGLSNSSVMAGAAGFLTMIAEALCESDFGQDVDPAAVCSLVGTTGAVLIIDGRRMVAN
jgi:hypothetical protein